MSDKLNTKPFQNLLCETCGEKVNVSTGDGYWRVDPSTKPWRVLGWHMDCRDLLTWSVGEELLDDLEALLERVRVWVATGDEIDASPEEVGDLLKRVYEVRDNN